MNKIVFLEPLGISESELKEIIDGKVNDVETVYYNTVPKNSEETIERAKDADCIVLAQVKIPAEVIDACPKLKYINIAFTGVDHVDVAHAKQKGIKVSNCSGYSTSAVADLVFGLTISLLRNIKQCDDVTRKEGTKNGLVGFELEGKTFGVVGAGKIGQRVIEIAKAFGCNVLAYSRTPKNIPGVSFVSLDELLRRSDVVSLHVPANAETKNLINEERLSLMKKSGILINTARGPVVDNEALRKALDNGTIAAAGIDVFDYEPPLKKDYCLVDAKNILLTPHVGFATKEAFVKRAHIVAANLEGYLTDTYLNLV